MIGVALTKNSIVLLAHPPLLPSLKVCRQPLPLWLLSSFLCRSMQTSRTAGLRSQLLLSSILKPYGTPSRETRILSRGQGKWRSLNNHLSSTAPKLSPQNPRKNRISFTLIIYLTTAPASFSRHAALRPSSLKLARKCKSTTGVIIQNLWSAVLKELSRSQFFSPSTQVPIPFRAHPILPGVPLIKVCPFSKQKIYPTQTLQWSISYPSDLVRQYAEVPDVSRVMLLHPQSDPFTKCRYFLIWVRPVSNSTFHNATD